MVHKAFEYIDMRSKAVRFGTTFNWKKLLLFLDLFKSDFNMELKL